MCIDVAIIQSLFILFPLFTEAPDVTVMKSVARPPPFQSISAVILYYRLFGDFALRNEYGYV